MTGCCNSNQRKEYGANDSEYGSRVRKRERTITKHLHRIEVRVGGKVERDRLCEAAEVGDAQHGLAKSIAQVKFAKIGQNFTICRVQESECSASENLKELAQSNHVACPVEEAGLVT